MNLRTAGLLLIIVPISGAVTLRLADKLSSPMGTALTVVGVIGAFLLVGSVGDTD